MFTQVFILPFFGVPFVVPITIELPDLDSQTEFNLARWEQVLADPTLSRHSLIVLRPISTATSS
jgi:hypothetical protein